MELLQLKSPTIGDFVDVLEKELKEDNPFFKEVKESLQILRIEHVALLSKPLVDPLALPSDGPLLIAANGDEYSLNALNRFIRGAKLDTETPLEIMRILSYVLPAILSLSIIDQGEMQFAIAFAVFALLTWSSEKLTAKTTNRLALGFIFIRTLLIASDAGILIFAFCATMWRTLKWEISKGPQEIEERIALLNAKSLPNFVEIDRQWRQEFENNAIPELIQKLHISSRLPILREIESRLQFKLSTPADEVLRQIQLRLTPPLNYCRFSTLDSDREAGQLLTPADFNSLIVEPFLHLAETTFQTFQANYFSGIACKVCGSQQQLAQCSHCFSAFYCVGKDCQRKDWTNHKTIGQDLLVTHHNEEDLFTMFPIFEKTKFLDVFQLVNENAPEFSTKFKESFEPMFGWTIREFLQALKPKVDSNIGPKRSSSPIRPRKKGGLDEIVIIGFLLQILGSFGIVLEPKLTANYGTKVTLMLFCIFAVYRIFSTLGLEIDIDTATYHDFPLQGGTYFVEVLLTSLLNSIGLVAVGRSMRTLLPTSDIAIAEQIRRFVKRTNYEKGRGPTPAEAPLVFFDEIAPLNTEFKTLVEKGDVLQRVKKTGFQTISLRISENILSSEEEKIPTAEEFKTFGRQLADEFQSQVVGLHTKRVGIALKSVKVLFKTEKALGAPRQKQQHRELEIKFDAYESQNEIESAKRFNSTWRPKRETYPLRPEDLPTAKEHEAPKEPVFAEAVNMKKIVDSFFNSLETNKFEGMETPPESEPDTVWYTRKFPRRVITISWTKSGQHGQTLIIKGYYYPVFVGENPKFNQEADDAISITISDNGQKLWIQRDSLTNVLQLASVPWNPEKEQIYQVLAQDAVSSFLGRMTRTLKLAIGVTESGVPIFAFRGISPESLVDFLVLELTKNNFNESSEIILGRTYRRFEHEEAPLAVSVSYYQDRNYLRFDVNTERLEEYFSDEKKPKFYVKVVPGAYMVINDENIPFEWHKDYHALVAEKLRDWIALLAKYTLTVPRTELPRVVVVRQ